MDDLIRRQEAIVAVLYAKDDLDAERLINGLPYAQRKGKWLEKKVIPIYENGFSLQSCKCSECGRYDTRPYMHYFSEPNFCSYCGVEMKGEKDETD